MSSILDSLLVLQAEVSPSPPSSPTHAGVAHLLPSEALSNTTPSQQAMASSANTASVGDKHLADDDLAQFADMTGRRVRLRLAGQQELRMAARASLCFSVHLSYALSNPVLNELSPDEHILWLGAHLLRNEEHMEDIQPANAQWTMPKLLKVRGVLLNHSYSSQECIIPCRTRSTCIAT